MYSRIHYPKQVPPAELDDYLAAGWRCVGQAIYTSHFMRFPPGSNGRIYSTVPSRLPLQGYAFSKRLRKLWRRTQRAFRLEAGQPFAFDAAAEAVHERYIGAFPDRPLADLEAYRERRSGPFTFDTREVRVYEGDRLVAFSVFKLGQRSLYSSQGIYDPAYGKHSLGFFTMLAEVDYAQSQRCDYFYPGYVVPGYPDFDYKKRLGELEYFSLSQNRWQPISEMGESQVPINQMRSALSSLQQQLRQKGVAAHLAEYSLFDIRFFDNRPLPFLEYPLVLLPGSLDPAHLCPLAVFDPITLTYTLLSVKFFGIGVHHLPVYRKIMAARPRSISYPIAVLEPLGEGLSEEGALACLLGYI